MTPPCEINVSGKVGIKCHGSMCIIELKSMHNSLISSLWGPGTAKFQVDVTSLLYCTPRVYRCGSAARQTADSCHELIDAKPKSTYRTFSFIFLHENSQRGYIRVTKVRLFKDRHTQSTMGASSARKWTRLGHFRVLRHQLAQEIRLFLTIITCFSCAAMVFRYSKRVRTFFT